MNIEKLTDRSKGFLQNAESYASKNSNQYLAPEHLLKVLLDDKEGVASSLIKEAGSNPTEVLMRVVADIETVHLEMAVFIFFAYDSHRDHRQILPAGQIENTFLFFFHERAKNVNDLASDVNVKNGLVYYRKLNERMITCFDISKKTTSQLPMNNVGRFVLYEDEIY